MLRVQVSYRTNNTEYFWQSFLRDVIERQLLKIVEIAKNIASSRIMIYCHGIPDILQGDPLNTTNSSDSAMAGKMRDEY